MIIEKKPSNFDAYRLNWAYFASARQGLSHALHLEAHRCKSVLLPAYIGLSAREGSGVFDPIRTAGIRYGFYRLDPELNIDLIELEKNMKKHQGNILLLIYYFGFAYKNEDIINDLAKKYNMVVIKDLAHAFYTFYRKPVVDFDYAIFSLHKLFPYDQGGLLLSKYELNLKNKYDFDILNYNMDAIIKKRINNYNYILEKLMNMNSKINIVILKKILIDNVPQSFPILLENTVVRDHLYYSLNKAGYGVVSLYHELIDAIDPSYVTEHNISQRILNLPVHQDVEFKDLDAMINMIPKIIDACLIS